MSTNVDVFYPDSVFDLKNTFVIMSIENNLGVVI